MRLRRERTGDPDTKIAACEGPGTRDGVPRTWVVGRLVLEQRERLLSAGCRPADEHAPFALAEGQAARLTVHASTVPRRPGTSAPGFGSGSACEANRLCCQIVFAMSLEPDVRSSPRAFRVQGLVNGRDLGGLRRRDGTTTPAKVFYRSENVDWITGEGWEQLRAEGIRTIVDLRQPGERAQDRGHRPEWLTTRLFDLDGLDNQAFWANYWDNGLVGTALYYLAHLEAMPERTAAALSAIVSAPVGGVLFHCMGGRDRTGMIAMILLAAIDTEPEQIVDDYLETVRLGDLRAASAKRNNAEPDIDALCQRHGTTTESAFRTALQGFDLTRFLDSVGLSGADQQLLSTWRGAVS
jgi:protein tyrosine/serine phosphatase